MRRYSLVAWVNATPSSVLPHKSLRPGARKRGGGRRDDRVQPKCNLR